MARLVRLFEVATPAEVRYKELETKYKNLEFKKAMADEMIRRLKVDNVIRIEATQQMRELEEETMRETRELRAANKEMSAKLTVERAD